MKNFFKKKTVFAIVISVLLIVCLIVFIEFKNQNIQELLSSKYDSVVCMDKKCNNIVTFQSKNKKKYVKILDKNGNIISKYEYSKNKKDPFYVSKNYILMSKKINKNKYEYSINNIKIEEKYKTKNILSNINSNLILETKKSNIDYDYDIIDLNGKKIFKNIREYTSYKNGNILFGTKDNHNYIISKTGKILLDGYDVVEEKDKYLVLKSSKETVYYYFDLQKQEIVNDGFSNYIIDNDDALNIVRKENAQEVAYKISENGKEEKITKNLYTVIKNIQDEFKNKNYKLYTESVIDENTNEVFVDNKNNDSFGIYDLKKKKYNKMYEYLTNVNETKIRKLKSLNEKIYFQISCSKPICLNSKLYVFDYEQSKILFKSEDSNNMITEYHHYDNNYKVVRYSNTAKNDEYKGKYVLYNDKNEELQKSTKYITIIDSKIVIGKKFKKTLLYSSKDNKLLNSSDDLAYLVGNKYYIYNDKLLTEKGKIIYQEQKKLPLKYSNNSVYSVDDKKAYIYDINSKLSYTYTLSKNESIVESFNSYIIVNNSEDKYIKFIDMEKESNNTKRLNNIIIYKVISNKNSDRKYIITKSTKTSKYGLYLIK